MDMDGTVISHKQGKVLESTKDAICQLRERGIKVFAATGRHILEMEELPVKGISFDGYVMTERQFVWMERNNLCMIFRLLRKIQRE